jgi:hypothetical protein
MGRTRHIDRDAKPTTISLTIAQQIAFQELQVRRLREGSSKPTLTEVMVEGFELLLKREGLGNSELGKIFPKKIQPKATVRVITRRRRS